MSTGADTFDAPLISGVQSLNSSDSLIGGDGTDTLIASLLAGTFTPTLTSVDRLQLTTNGTTTLNLLNSTGVTAIENANSTGVLTISNISNVSATLKDSNNANGTTFAYTTAAVASTTADTANLTLSAVTGGTTTIQGIEILNVTSSGAANTTTIADTSLLTLNVAGDQDLTLGTLPATATTVGAGTLTGKLSVTAANTTAATVTGGTGADTLTGAAGNDSISGGAGNDSLTGAAGNDTLSGAAGVDTITGGAGNDNISGGDDADILVFADNAELIADGTVSGGAATDTIRFTGDVGADINEASLVNTRISGVEALDFRGPAAAQRTVTLTDAAMTAQGTTTFTVTDAQFGSAAATNGLDINASALTAANSIDATFNNRGIGEVTVSTAAGATTDTLVFAVGGTTYASYTAVSGTETATVSAAGIAAAINAAAAGTFVATNAGAVISIASSSPGVAFPTATLTSAGSFRLTVGGVANGAAGASTVPTVAADNSYTGGAGADTFRVLAVGGGLTAADTLAGGTGTDTLRVTGGAAAATTVVMTNVSTIENITTVGTGLVTVNTFAAATIAATGTLTVDASSQTTATLGLNFDASGNTNAGKVSVTGGAGNDTIIGSAGSDTISGGSGNDTITAGAGNDSLSGGDGNDTFTYATEAAFSDDTGPTVTMDTVAGGAGTIDILEFTGAAATLSAAQLANVTGVEIIALAITASTVTLTDAVVDANGGDIQQVRVTTAGTVTASALTAPNSIAVRAEAATDGDVSVTGGAGNDSVTFSGNTTGLLGATDAVKLGAGTADVINVTNVNGHTAGTGAASAATLSSLITGVESLVISDLATDQALGDVTITLDSTFTATTFTVDGSALDAGETLTFTNTANTSTTTTPAAAVSVTGGAGDDALTGGVAADTLIGGAGADGLTGGAGVDNLSGGDGVDTFTVATLADFVSLTAVETVSGGDGNDILSITATGTINASDLLGMNSIFNISLGSAGTQTVVLSDAVFTANGATTLTLTEAGTSTISVNASGLTSANSVQITTADRAVNETLVGGAGNDTFTATLGTGTIAAGDTITGGAGTDTVILSTTGNGTVDFTGVTGIEIMSSALGTGGATTNTLTFAAVPDTLLAAGITLTMNFADRTGSVIMNATNSEADGKFNITTGTAADTITGGAGADTVDGGSGNDTITAGAGNDTLFGNAGDDTLAGGTGADTLTGGTGNDLFQFTTVAGSSGTTIDTITDFVTGGGSTANTDRIAITLDYQTLTSALTINPQRAGTGQAGLTDSQTALSGDRGQFIYDTTNSRLYVNVNADNLITSQDYTINVNAGSTASTTFGLTDLSFLITGGTGADAIYSGASYDTIAGGAGTDTIYFTANNAPAGEVISGGADTDTIYITTGTTFVAANFGVDNTTNTVLTAGLVENIVITTGQTATFLATQLTGQAISVNATAVGAANLVITAADANADFTNLTFTATGGQNAFDTGVDTVTINMLSTTASRSITGTTLADNITGGTLADVIIGGAGNDTLTGGLGADVITGSAGADSIILTEGTAAIDTVVYAAVDTTVFDTITGFIVANDLIDWNVALKSDNATASAPTAYLAVTAAAQTNTITGSTTAVVIEFANAADALGEGTAGAAFSVLTATNAEIKAEVIKQLATDTAVALTTGTANQNLLFVMYDEAGNAAVINFIESEGVGTTIDAADTIQVVGVLSTITIGDIATANFI